MPAIFCSPANAALLGRPVDPLAAVKAATRYYYGFQDSPDDTSGNGLNLTAVNSPTYVDGVIGRAARFVAASSHYMTIAHNDLLNVIGPHTFAVNFRFGATAASQYFAVKYHNSTATDQGYLLWTNSSSAVNYSLRTTTGVTTVAHGSTLTTGTWYRAICKWDGATMTVKVNGVGTTATGARDGTPYNTTGMPLRVASYPSNTTPPSVFAGVDIDRLWLIAKHTTDEEDAAIFALPADPF
jgi:hypothetical protein